ncbi:MAG: hypothetical protein GC180_05090 [Bacteroidetes bacterium]|nr:hypothetical protein [Bacteroidota bacterium]
MEQDWILLNTYVNPNDAHVVMSMLEENGIRVVSLNKRDSSYGVFGLIELYCHVNQAHQAMDLIESSEDE